MNLYLLEKAVRFKYLQAFVLKSSSNISCYFLVNQRKIFLEKTAETFPIRFQVSKKFLGLLFNKKSIVNWQWLRVFSGVVYLCTSFNYDINFTSIEKLLTPTKNYLFLGGFYRQKFLSRSEWLKFIKDLKPFSALKSKEIRQNMMVKNILNTKIFSLFLLLFCFKLIAHFIKNIENQQ